MLHNVKELKRFDIVAVDGSSPLLEADMPVSKKYEVEFNNYYGLRPY